MGFSLITYGGLRLVRPDSSMTEIPTHRAQALLLFLVVHRESAVHRETICAALWPDSGEAAARAQLRKALWRLRTAAGTDQDAAPLFCNEYQIGLDPARIDVDLWRFNDAMRGLELKDDATLNQEDAEVLLRALDLNRDMFGRGVFDDWLLAEQGAQREARILAMERLVAFHRVKGHLSQAITWAQRALKLDPLREHLHVSIIECMQAMGDRALALRQYRDCEDVLRREIGVTPSLQVRRLFQGLSDDR
jgi:DNA-binding SARP family transcriptional activator